MSPRGRDTPGLGEILGKQVKSIKHVHGDRPKMRKRVDRWDIVVRCLHLQVISVSLNLMGP